MLSVQSAAVDIPEHDGALAPRRDSLRGSSLPSWGIQNSMQAQDFMWFHLLTAISGKLKGTRRGQGFQQITAEIGFSSKFHEGNGKNLLSWGTRTKSKQTLTWCEKSISYTSEILGQHHIESPSRTMSKCCYPKVHWAQCPVPKREGGDD